jgi:peptidyl-prolyl cis-trans isomerase A (cyclophilin A)
MRRILYVAFLIALLSALLIAAPAAFSQQKPAGSEVAAEGTNAGRADGLYMTFETTMGNIHCRLHETLAPITVRKIVGLAVGKLSYVDPKTKQTVKGKRFYDGLTFHRVMPKFMIQGGDPLGTGYGGPEGPGFPFQDEFAPALRFDAPGRLAMANAGPNSNGSQFFITEVAASYLNDKHTIFGDCGDLDVVKAIARVPAESEQPVKPVVIKRVTIERVGPAPADPPEASGSKPE